MKTTPGHWPKNRDQIALFDDSEAFALVSENGADGHALLRERIEKEEAAADQARRQQEIPL